ncbi:zinc metalloprotease [Adhaeretor mobilis]|uniref:Peptidase C-terminal archaeal/bacterial domain-containing protein n=1 Tax=Adhaeretor mobilis TaxID=1930276 RepID=A0A517MTM3_9BACT|nr:hypothetical protein [Adhaeretor mobilis]QDS98236.1 hypothetical protein HG15A2_15090 [Adhaeretor mobilis]
MRRTVRSTFLFLFLAILLAGRATTAFGTSQFPAYIDGVLDLGDDTAQAPYALADTFNLDSSTTASKTIYLDFTGYHSVSNSWGHNIVFPAYDQDGDDTVFSDGELEEIQKIFQNVAEDFLPFNVNVTTEFPGAGALQNSGGADTTWGVRVVMTQPTAGFGVGIGGNSGSAGFDDAGDNPVFVFNKGNRKAGMTASHEAAHTFGLTHDGISGGADETYDGTGSGSTSWGPIMGSPFQANVTQWSDGNYTGATNFADDIDFLTSRGFGFRSDDYPTSVTSPHVLNEVNSSIFEWGIIEQQTDVDFFQFTSAPGEVSIDVRGFGQDPNLDVKLTLYDGSGAVVAVVDPTVTVNAPLNMILEAGSYVISVEGDAGPGHFDDYGSLGFYTIDIEVPLFADLNNDSQLDHLDWQQFLAGSGTDLSGLTSLEAYQAGDLDGDGLNNAADFGLFKDAYIEAFGLAGFEALFVQVPEPTSLLLATLALTACLRRNRFILNNQPSCVGE